MAGCFIGFHNSWEGSGSQVENIVSAMGMRISPSAAAASIGIFSFFQSPSKFDMASRISFGIGRVLFA